MNQIVATGALGEDPQIRFLESGQAVCNFSLADTPRKFNKSTKVWEDQDTNWFKCTAWGTLAEHISESFHKGDPVMVVGKITTRKWTDRNGTNRADQSIQVDECGPAVSRGITRQQRAERKPAPRTAAPPDPFSSGPPSAQSDYDDPWATPAARPMLDEPPF